MTLPPVPYPFRLWRIPPDKPPYAMNQLCIFPLEFAPLLPFSDPTLTPCLLSCHHVTSFLTPWLSMTPLPCPLSLPSKSIINFIACNDPARHVLLPALFVFHDSTPLLLPPVYALHDLAPNPVPVCPITILTLPTRLPTCPTASRLMRTLCNESTDALSMLISIAEYVHVLSFTTVTAQDLPSPLLVPTSPHNSCQQEQTTHILATMADTPAPTPSVTR